MIRKISFIALAGLFGCSGIQDASTKMMPAWTAEHGRAENPSAVPLLYKKTATIGHGWPGINGVAVDQTGDVFVATGDFQVKEVRPPFTGPTHGKIKTLVKCCEYAPGAVGVDSKGDEFFLSVGGSRAGLYRIGPNG